MRIWTLLKFAGAAVVALVSGLVPPEVYAWLRDAGEDASVGSAPRATRRRRPRRR